MIEPHLHWTFAAYNDADVITEDRINWMIEVSVTGRYTEEEAIVAARATVSRDQYRLRRVYECTTCGYQESAAKSLETFAENSK